MADDLKLSGQCLRCQMSNALLPHVCPYKLDIHDDDETLCTCCEDCTRECADDI